jgi:AcrR family transcriptional regulator
MSGQGTVRSEEPDVNATSSPAENDGSVGSRPLGRPPNSDSVATRRAILAAASAQLASVGYTRMNLQTVAAEVGITRGAIYRYFDSKRELVRAAVVDAPAAYEELIAQYVLVEQGLLEQLRALIHVTVSTSFQYPRSSLNYFELARLAEEDENIADVFRTRSIRIRSVIMDLVRQAEQRGELSVNADQAGIVDAISGLLWSMGAGASEAPNDVVRRQVLRATELLLQQPDWMALPAEAPEGRSAAPSSAG